MPNLQELIAKESSRYHQADHQHNRDDNDSRQDGRWQAIWAAFIVPKSADRLIRR